MGTEIDTNISPLSIAFLPGPTQNSSTESCLLPLGPAILQTALCAINAGIPSPLGAELHKFPPKVALP